MGEDEVCEGCLNDDGYGCNQCFDEEDGDEEIEEDEEGAYMC